MKKILVFSEYSMGRYIEGTNKVILELSQALKESGYDVTILTPKWAQDKGLTDDYNLNGVKIHRFYFPLIANPMFRAMGYFFNGVKYCLKEKYDIFYGLYTLAPICATVFLGGLLGKKRVISIWEPPTVHVLKKIRLPLSVDGILTLSNDVASLVEKELGIKKEQIKIIPGQYDGKVMYPQKKDASLMKKYNPLNKFLILSVGRVSVLKGAQDLLDAARSLDVVMVFVGREVEPQNIRKTDNSRFAGFVDDKELPKYYNLCDLFVLPSHNEGFGIVVTEAMACGVPVIVSDTPPLPEVAGNGGMVFPVGDVKKLRERINYLMTNPSRLKELKANALDRAKLFEKKAVMKQYVSFFDKVLG